MKGLGVPPTIYHRLREEDVIIGFINEPFIASLAETHFVKRFAESGRVFVSFKTFGG